MRFCLIKETKDPPDKRTPLTPEQIEGLKNRFPGNDFFIESSSNRCFSDDEYRNAGINIVKKANNCDVLFGIKEVKESELIKDKTYFFFSHTAKKQAHNRELLKKCVSLGITLIDYEYLLNESGRVVAFGYWAGLIGAYNALIGYGKLSDSYKLKPAHECFDLAQLKKELENVRFESPLKVIITGEGRVAGGASEILQESGIKEVSPEDFLINLYDRSVFCKIGPQYYTKHKDGLSFSFHHFAEKPFEYVPDFYRFAKAADMFIACHYWDNRSPVFFTLEQMRDPEFSIRLVADVSCDIPGPIPSTIRASSIESPFYGFDMHNATEIRPFQTNNITVMAVDNLPGELPRDASVGFGDQLCKYVFPELLSGKHSEFLDRATILKNGELTPGFRYLKDFLNGE